MGDAKEVCSYKRGGHAEERVVRAAYEPVKGDVKGVCYLAVHEERPDHKSGDRAEVQLAVRAEPVKDSVKEACSLAVLAESLEIGCDLHGDHTEERVVRAAYEPVKVDVKGVCSLAAHEERLQI
jgi:hypothetical protein